MVAIATLLLSVFTVGFTTYVVNEINRTTNFDLSKSAYDSALAGIEDAKLAIMNYESCKEKNGVVASQPDGNGTVTCDEILYIMENSPSCFMVGQILGRIGETEEKEVLIRESNEAGNNMQQAYTCVEISNPRDYRTRLNSGNSTRVIPIKLKNGNVSEVKSIRISWGDNSGININNTLTRIGGTVEFPSLDSSSVSNPPAISVQLIQTSPQFNLEDFNYSRDNAKTDRGTVVLVPSNTATGRPAETVTETNIDVTQNNIISATKGFVKSNDKTTKNLPFLVKCPQNADDAFLCTASIGIPDPVGENGRSDETFALVVSLPYGGPDTDIAISVCNTAGACDAYSTDDNLATGSTSSHTFELSNQIRIDSTGRANNLFRRIETRITKDTNPFYGYTYDAIQALGDSSDTTIRKTITSNAEMNFFEAPAVYAGLNTFTLNFNAGNCPSAYGIPASQSIRESTLARFYIAGNTPTCDNYNFMGWGTSPTSTTNLYRPNQVFTIQASSGNLSQTLYAIWEAQKFTITYHPFNSNSEVLKTEIVSYGTAKEVLTSTPIPSLFNGFSLYGWSTKINDNTAEYVIGDANRNKVTVTQNIDLYAVWRKAKTFKFYQLNGQTTEATAYFYNQYQSATISVPVINSITVNNKETHTRGWSTSYSRYEAAPFTPGQNAIVHPNDPEQYYASSYYVAKAQYIVLGHVYNPGNSANDTSYVYLISKGPSSNASQTYNIAAGSITLPYVPKETVRSYQTGYELDKWAAGAPSGTQYQPNRVISNFTADITYYATVKPSTFTVTFKSYDGSILYGTQDFTYGTATAIRGAAATSGWSKIPNNYKPNSSVSFYGWSYSSNSNTRNYTNGQSITTQFHDDDIILYAVWNRTLTAKFYSNDGVSEKLVTIYNAATSGNITTPNVPDNGTLTKYAWSNNSSSVGTTIDKASHTRTITSNENWYAVYSKTVKISYNKTISAATGSTSNTTGTGYVVYKGANNKTDIAAQIQLNTCGFSLVGRSFSHWNIGSTSGTAKLAGSFYETTTDVVAYANWTSKVYEITLSPEYGNGTATVSSPTSKIYVVYGSQYTKDSAGNSTISSSNTITLPGKKYIVTLHYSNASTSTHDVNAAFKGYYKGSTQVINTSGYINSGVSTTFFNDDTVAANRKFTGDWNAGSFTLTAEAKDNYTCKWRQGSTSGAEKSGTVNITSNTDFYSVCVQNNYTVSFSPTSDGYISKSATAGGEKFTGTVTVKSGTEVKISNNELYFTDNSSVKYYAHANNPGGYTFDGWSGISNGNTITSDKTISASWTAIPYTCPSGATLNGTTCYKEATSSIGDWHCTSWTSKNVGYCTACAAQAPSSYSSGDFERSYSKCDSYTLVKSEDPSCPVNETSSLRPHLNSYKATQTEYECDGGYNDTNYNCPSYEWNKYYDSNLSKTMCSIPATQGN